MGQGTGPRRLGDILGKLFAQRGYAAKTARLELEECWRRVAGERFRLHTRVGALRRGVLEILVDNAVLLQELEGFHREPLLQSLRQQVRQSAIQGLRFRRA